MCLQGQDSFVLLVLSGGKGTRLRSVSGDLPKGLVSIDKEGLVCGVGHIARIAKTLRMKDVALLTYYLADKFQDAIIDHDFLEVRRQMDKGTAVAIQEAIDIFGYEKQYVVVSADTYFSASDLSNMLEHHKSNSITISLSAYSEEFMQESYPGISFKRNTLDDQEIIMPYEWGSERNIERDRYAKGGVLIFDPKLYTKALNDFRANNLDQDMIDVYWDIETYIEKISKDKEEPVIRPFVFKNPIIDFGTPERLDYVRKIYDPKSTEL